MESSSNTIYSPQNNRTIRFTPRELIKYHIEHPEVPITDKDIENLLLENSADSDLIKEYQAFKNDNGVNQTNSNNHFTNSMLF